MQLIPAERISAANKFVSVGCLGRPGGLSPTPVAPKQKSSVQHHILSNSKLSCYRIGAGGVSMRFSNEEG
jgi:hypothetical protein